MNLKLILVILAAAYLEAYSTSLVLAQSSGGPADVDPPSENKPAPKTPRVRWPKPIPLPDLYRSKDSDKDGQIGMYEWPRSDYAAFRRLDLNHDGFLTPEELTRGTQQSASRSRSAPPETTATPPAIVASTTAVSAAGLPGSAASSATPPAPTGSRSEAERIFEVTDKDKDGKITAEEWNRSYLAKPKFEKAGIGVTFPLPRDEFIRLYP